MTIYGWDASDFDVSRGLTVAEVGVAATQGIKFFTFKATEGTWVQHENMPTFVTAARNTNIPFIGVYVVPRSGYAAYNQAKYALDYVQSVASWLLDFPGFFWQVDTEKWPYDSVSPTLGEAVCNELEKLTPGRKAIHYAPKWAYGDTVPNVLRPLWSSNYEDNLSLDFRDLYVHRGGDSGPGWDAYSGRVPKIWQYGSRAIIGGQSTCDANAFRGTEADFATMINAIYQPPATPVGEPELGGWIE